MDLVPADKPPRLMDTPGLARGVLLLCLLSMFLSVWFHHDRSWDGDEWGSYMAFSDSYHTLFTHFQNWETMNFYLASLKLIHDQFGANKWLLVLPGILTGGWLVWLVASLALRLHATKDAVLTAALLVAVNPFLVGYSVDIRAYIFLTACSTAMMLCLFDWRQAGRWTEGVLCGLSGALGLLSHLNAIYMFVAVSVLAICWTIIRARRHEPYWFARFMRLAIPVIVLGGLAAAAYIPQASDIVRFRFAWSDTPPTPVNYLPVVLTRFFGKGYLLLPALTALLYSAWRSSREGRQTQWLLLAIIVMVASISMAGVSHFPWAYSRFLIAALPWLVLLIADGLWPVAGRWQWLAWVAVAVITTCSLVALKEWREHFHRYPWDHMAHRAKQAMAPKGICVVIGDPVNRVGLYSYGVLTCGSLDAVLSSIPTDKTLRIVLVDTAGVFKNESKAETIGLARILTLEDKPHTLCDQVVKILVAGTGDRVSGDFAPVYEQLATLLRWAGRVEEASKYDRLRYRCLFWVPEVINAPPQFLQQGRFPQ